MSSQNLTNAGGDGWPDIDRGWLHEALKYSSPRNLTFDEALNHVALRYLRLGDARPLLDGVLRLRWQPGSDLLKHLADMILARTPDDIVSKGLEYRIGIRLHRSPGRPAIRLSPEMQAERDRQVMFLNAVRIAAVGMAEGRMPGQKFWMWLSVELEPSCIPPTIPTLSIPIRAAIVPVSGKRGRRINPELDARDEVLGQMVRQRLGKSVKRAVGDVYEVIQRIAQVEGWTGELNEETVHKAFALSRHAKS